jgi:uncharacterized protein with ATP-grasp and redox domains
VFAYLSQADYKTSTTPELIGEIFSLLKRETQNEDPYLETRRKYNRMFLDREAAFEKEINEADDTFTSAIKYAIIGNLIDFNPIHNLLLSDIETYFDRLKQEPLEIDDSALLMCDIKQSDTILISGITAGRFVWTKYC